MTDAVYANNIALQQNDSVRLIFQDSRPGAQPQDAMVNRIMAEVVLSIPNARALRDLLVEHIKDDPVPGSMN